MINFNLDETLCSCQGARGGAPGAGCWKRGAGDPPPNVPGSRRVKAFEVFSRAAVPPLGHIPCLPRKEVIQPHVPVRLPCYDFTPLTLHTFDASAPRRVRPAASGADDSGGVTGGVYKARERIHRGVLIRDY